MSVRICRSSGVSSGRIPAAVVDCGVDVEGEHAAEAAKTRPTTTVEARSQGRIRA
jgi:hypothetical protein